MLSSPHYILEILSIHGIGPARYWDLIDTFGCPKRIANTDVKSLQAVLTPSLAAKVVDIDATICAGADKIIRWCAANQVTILTHEDDKYPTLLKEIVRGPPLLYVKGNIACLNQPQLAIVGSRSASQAGQKNAFQFSAVLAEAGLCVTSGLALGIDTEAHLGALSVGGKTIAVIGSGINKIYPTRNRYLYDRIVAEGGAIVSEFPLNTPPIAENFPRRNRIISGLSYGCLVIEAAMKSGSLITARCALEQNREVFAIPGSINNPRSRGCHSLIKQGANLVESAADIVEHLTGFAAPTNALVSNEVKGLELSEQEQKVLSFVEHEPVSLESIAERSKIDLGSILSLLMSLELKGIICQNAAGYTRI